MITLAVYDARARAINAATSPYSRQRGHALRPPNNDHCVSYPNTHVAMVFSHLRATPDAIGHS